MRFKKKFKKRNFKRKKKRRTMLVSRGGIRF